MWNTIGAALAAQNISGMQNSAYQQGLSQQQNYYRPPQPSVEEQIERLEYEKIKIERELNHLVSQSHLIGPTIQELDSNVSLRHAWDEYRCVRKLLGLK